MLTLIVSTDVAINETSRTKRQTFYLLLLSVSVYARVHLCLGHRLRPPPPPSVPCSESAEARHGNRRGITNPGIPDCAPFNEEQHGLDASGNTSGTKLHHLALGGTICQTRSRLHPIVAGLVTLCLGIIHPSAYFQPNIQLQYISFMSQLESRDRLFIPY